MEAVTERAGQFSTPVKVIVAVVAALVVLLIYLTVQQGLLKSMEAPIIQFIQGSIGTIQ